MKKKSTDLNNLLLNLVTSSNESIVFANLAGIVEFTNPAAEKLYGYGENELIGKNVDIFNSQLTHNTDQIVDAIKTQGHWSGELIQRRKDNSTFFAALTVSLIMDGKSNAIGFGSHSHDISIRKQNEAQVEHLVNHDGLTNLPNSSLLFDRIDQCISSSKDTGFYNALITLDLDPFKAINDELGHTVGDLLLQTIAKRITSCIQQKDTVARMGSNEFSILLKNLDKDKNIAKNLVKTIAENIQKSINQDMLLEGHQILVKTNIGIYLFNGKKENLENIIKNADITLYLCRKKGKDQIQFFESNMQDTTSHHK